MSERSWKQLVWWIAAYAIAMALLEAAVVVYLRALYYPHGFGFPLTPVDHDLGVVEVAREAATMLMLLAPAALVARSSLTRFAWFCFAFGVWDIFYYVWLKVFLDWPATLVDWDILFLIPVPWMGPVLAPCIISIGLITLAVILLRSRERSSTFKLARRHWALLLGGGAIMIFSFMLDYLGHLSSKGALSTAWSIGPGSADTFASATDYVPAHFPWWLFLAGCAAAAFALFELVRSGRTPRPAH
jgi:hypothetical protein